MTKSQNPFATSRHGLGDPRIPWMVILEVDLAVAHASPEELTGQLTRLADEAGWPRPGPEAVILGERRDLLARLARGTAEPVRIGVHPEGIILAARHAYLDGLGMLMAAGILVGLELRSSARGLSPDRAAGAGATGALVRRAWEVLVRPPARVAASRSSSTPGDSFFRSTYEAPLRTADLVYAGARATAAWNLSHGASSRRLSVAVGVSTVSGTASALCDLSAFLRLTDVEALDRQQIGHRLATGSVQPNSVPETVDAVSGTLLRLAAPRLGSTLLVSHLGEVSVPGDAVAPLGFYPVTGGDSGVSLGAITVAGRTTLTLRSRAARHGDDDLERLMELVLDALS